MDYFERDLASVIQVDRKIDLLSALNTVRSLNIALNVLKSAGVVHLDLKPQNVLVDDQNQP